ncbi:hypothetical protein AMAG_12449 [Allomyces macrogynus ATCC 38327]|uniref:F-box domain-containing protein n=1 Tax=Allomyces macrogynus (strain ATCC 38327) TaxID=578462 RepID=A0A0L0SYT3_ALLM3|nr:hypothetical protein AMAG_12449 [Allomyces macrogynus ATCC 38327]|eukprot:KNE67718.1 hypothetical protein AMAG_12449 [Allomyces macrogynus ATCC 38327]
MPPEPLAISTTTRAARPSTATMTTTSSTSKLCCKPASTTPTTTPPSLSRCLLTDLPVEIIEQIICASGFLAAVRLSWTCHRLRALVLALIQSRVLFTSPYNADVLEAHVIVTLGRRALLAGYFADTVPHAASAVVVGVEATTVASPTERRRRSITSPASPTSALASPLRRRRSPATTRVFVEHVTVKRAGKAATAAAAVPKLRAVCRTGIVVDMDEVGRVRASFATPVPIRSTIPAVASVAAPAAPPVPRRRPSVLSRAHSSWALDDDETESANDSVHRMPRSHSAPTLLSVPPECTASVESSLDSLLAQRPWATATTAPTRVLRVHDLDRVHPTTDHPVVLEGSVAPAGDWRRVRLTVRTPADQAGWGRRLRTMSESVSSSAINLAAAAGGNDGESEDDDEEGDDDDDVLVFVPANELKLNGKQVRSGVEALMLRYLALM